LTSACALKGALFVGGFFCFYWVFLCSGGRFLFCAAARGRVGFWPSSRFLVLFPTNKFFRSPPPPPPFSQEEGDVQPCDVEIGSVRDAVFPFGFFFSSTSTKNQKKHFSVRTRGAGGGGGGGGGGQTVFFWAHVGGKTLRGWEGGAGGVGTKDSGDATSARSAGGGKRWTAGVGGGKGP